MTIQPHHLRAVPDPEPGREAAQRFSVSTQIVAAGEQDTSVRLLTPITGGTGPQVGVRVGRATVFVTDHAALRSFVDAWTQAAAIAQQGLPRSTENVQAHRS